MLVLTRKTGQVVRIGDRIRVTLGRMMPDGRVRLCIDAPKDVKIVREELVARDAAKASV